MRETHSADDGRSFDAMLFSLHCTNAWVGVATVAVAAAVAVTVAVTMTAAVTAVKGGG
jgi:hypothetical protein